MPATPKPNQPKQQKSRPEDEKYKTIFKATETQLGVQVRLLNGKRQSWPYAQLVTHTLEGGFLKIWFAQHLVTIRGRHLQDADDGLRLQSLVWLEETGVRRKEVLGESEIPEDQPAIDSMEIEYLGD